jgi:hypothetical protein
VKAARRDESGWCLGYGIFLCDIPHLLIASRSRIAPTEPSGKAASGWLPCVAGSR